ncbi:MAG: glycoside hydrolase family 88 protein [Ginsengibacter sp.]
MKKIAVTFFLHGCLMLFVSTTYCQNKSPLQVVEKVADKIIADTRFEFKLVPQTEQLSVQIIDFRFMKLNEGQTVYATRSAIVKTDTTVFFGITSPGRIQIWLNKKLIFQQEAQQAKNPKEISYDRFHFNKNFSAKIKKGENDFLIKYEANQSSPVVFFRPVTGTGDLDHSIQFEKSNQNSAWLYAGPFLNAGDLISPRDDLQTYYEEGNKKFINWQSAPQIFLPELLIDRNAAYQRDPYTDWQYSHGAMVWSIMNLGDAANMAQYNLFGKKYTDFILQHLEYFRWQYDSLFAFRGSYHRIFRLTMLDDAGAPALPFTALFIKQHDNLLKKIIDPVIDYVSNRQVRLPDSTFCRPEPVEYTVWADDLFMSVPLLLQAAEITGGKKYYDDAAKQAINFQKYLFDKKAGLYRHGWFSKTGKQSPVCWGRANGWIAWATAELLSALPKQHPLYKKIENNFRQHMENLLRYQAADGMWHQVLDNTESYEETSCTAMFTLAIARGVRNGWLSKKYKEYALKGWNAVADHITADGIVHGICRGTEIGADDQFYMNRKTIDNDPRGLGAVITAGVEISKLK